MEIKTYRELLEKYNYDETDKLQKQINLEFDIPRANLTNYERRKIYRRKQYLRELQLNTKYVNLQDILEFIRIRQNSNFNGNAILAMLIKSLSHSLGESDIKVAKKD